MERKQFAVLAMLATASGIAGGLLSGRVLPGTAAHAHEGGRAERVVRSESFQIVDSTGDVRAELCVCPEGKPGLVLIDKGYKVRARFALLENGFPGLELMDKAGRARARLSLSAEGNPTLVFFDGDGAGKAIWSAPGGAAAVR